MSNLIELDSYQTLATLFKRDHSADKFITAFFSEDGEDLYTHISPELGHMELTFIIQMLQDRRAQIFRAGE